MTTVPKAKTTMSVAIPYCRLLKQTAYLSSFVKAKPDDWEHIHVVAGAVPRDDEHDHQDESGVEEEELVASQHDKEREKAVDPVPPNVGCKPQSTRTMTGCQTHKR